MGVTDLLKKPNMQELFKDTTFVCNGGKNYGIQTASPRK